MIEPGPHLGHGGTEVHAAEPDFNHAIEFRSKRPASRCREIMHA
jgi:hypothetical protein